MRRERGPTSYRSTWRCYEGKCPNHTFERLILLEKELDIPFFADSKIPFPVPADATPKDGPGAGCTMVTSLLSLAVKKPVRKDLAMAGSYTNGKILPIGG